MRKRSDVSPVPRGADPGAAVGSDEALSNRRVLDLADVFSLLGDPGRLRLLLALRETELCVSDLAATTGQSDSAVSHALQLLRAHRIVSSRREGRRIYYRLDDTHVATLLDVALRHTDHSEIERPEVAS